MKTCAMLLAITALGFAQVGGAANTPPLAQAWNIAPSGTAGSSGELLFRVTPGDGADPTEITVSVSSGMDERGVASSIRRALNTQLRGDRFDVVAGEGANVMVTSDVRTGFSLELIDSGVENIRVAVAVHNSEPVVPPTVPRQATPAEPPTTTPATPPAPGDAAPPPPQQVPQSRQPAQPQQPVPEEATSDSAPPGMIATTLLPAPRFRYRFP